MGARSLRARRGRSPARDLSSDEHRATARGSDCTVEAALAAAPFAARRRFPRRSFLVQAEASAEVVYLISRGFVRVYRLAEDGRETTTALLGPGHLVGIAPLLRRSTHRVFAEALTAVEGWELPAPDLLARLPHDRALLRLVSGALAQRFAVAQGLLRGVALLPVAERIREIQLRLIGGLGGTTPALSQLLLAELVHARPETVSRVLRHPSTPTEPPDWPPGFAVHSGERVFRAGEVVFNGDLEGGLVGLIISGQVQLSLVAPDGRAVAIDTLGPGDLIGIPALVGQPATGLCGEALFDGVLRVLGADEFLQSIAEQPSALEQLASRLAARLELLEDALENATASNVNDRLAVLLCDLALTAGDREPGGGRALREKWPHARLARQLGVSRETITRALAVLEDRGVIRRCGRRIVVLVEELPVPRGGSRASCIGNSSAP